LSDRAGSGEFRAQPKRFQADPAKDGDAAVSGKCPAEGRFPEKATGSGADRWDGPQEWSLLFPFRLRQRGRGPKARAPAKEER